MKLAERIIGPQSDPSYIIDPDRTESTAGQPIYPCAPVIMPTISASAQNKLMSKPSLSSFVEALVGAKQQWTNGSSNVSIQVVPALTSKSCLFCSCGGQWNKLGKEQYLEQSTLQREEHVYDEIMKNRSRYIDAEFLEAQKYILCKIWSMATSRLEGFCRVMEVE